MDDGDVVVFMNFRADRARADHARADRSRVRRLRAHARAAAGGVRLPDELRRRVRAPAGRRSPRSRIANSFGEYVASTGLRQLRIAETEKYAHVTYFFNGGVEAAYPGEDRILVPSPKVATYDLKPEMSAREVTDKLVAAIEARTLRRDRLQLRQRRHGRPHRQSRRGDDGDRDARRVHRPGGRRRSARAAARC